jgi:ABC-type uncharacterized transport system, permease component
VKDFFSTYWLYIRVFFRGRVEYRLSFILGLLSNFYCYFITFATYWVLISGIGNVAGWNFSELSVLYGLSLLTYAIAGTLIWYTGYHMGDLVQSGKLDVFLMRPIGVLRQLIFQRFGDTFIGQIIVTIVFLVTAFSKLSNHLNGCKIIYLILSIIGGVLIQVASMIIVGSLSFFIVKSTEIGDIFYYDMRDMTQYPIEIFPKVIQYILTFVCPWAFINYYPSLLLLDKVSSRYEFILGIIAPLIGVIMLLLSLLIFNYGLKKYSGVGN